MLCVCCFVVVRVLFVCVCFLDYFSLRCRVVGLVCVAFLLCFVACVFVVVVFVCLLHVCCVCEFWLIISF